MKTNRAAWRVWGVTIALLVPWNVMLFLGHSQDLLAYLFLPPAIIGYATVGALITSRRPGNRIGVLFSLIALVTTVGGTAGAYAMWVFDGGASLPLAQWAAWVGHTAFSFTVTPIALIFLLYPAGELPSRRWRPVLVVFALAFAINVVLYALTPGVMSQGLIEFKADVMNPLGRWIPLSWKHTVEGITGLAGMVVAVCALLAVISLVFRFRRSEGEERQQIRWLLYVGATAAAIPILGIGLALYRIAAGIHVGDNDPLGAVLWISFVLLLIFGIPAASGIAILRYRLYDLDVVIKKTVVFLILVLILTAIFIVGALAVGGVLGLTGLLDWEGWAFVEAFVIGAVIAPLWRVSRRVADRVVYGGRSDPYEVLTEFSGRMSETYSTDDVLPRMAAVLGSATRAERAIVWLRVGRDLRPVAAWPDDVSGPTVRPDDAVDVSHQGESLGALSVTMPANDPMNPSKRKLIEDMAGQAGLVLRNVRLIEELRASRQRLVAAQDEERRKLERNLHDGVQQQLVALSVKLKLADTLAQRDGAKAHELLTQLQDETTGALEDLRDLARGIYPPLLADKGLASALEAQARKAAVPVTVEAGDVGRYSQDVEAAVYFCSLEALNNVAKYASASNATVHLSQENGWLSFDVTDDGVGFDALATSYGTGLQGMQDRVEAVGGELHVRSDRGRGTTVSGRVPARSPLGGLS